MIGCTGSISSSNIHSSHNIIYIISCPIILVQHFLCAIFSNHLIINSMFLVQYFPCIISSNHFISNPMFLLYNVYYLTILSLVMNLYVVELCDFARWKAVNVLINFSHDYCVNPLGKCFIS